jgi:hypothetical protein
MLMANTQRIPYLSSGTLSKERDQRKIADSTRTRRNRRGKGIPSGTDTLE